MRTISLQVAGADFPNKRGDPARRFEIALCRPGDPIALLPEPSNKHDPNAILILSERGVPIGYVAAERAPLIRRMIAEGAETKVIFQASTRTGAIVRATFDGSYPILPSAMSSPPTDPDFWPDPVWDDD